MLQRTSFFSALLSCAMAQQDQVFFNSIVLPSSPTLYETEDVDISMNGFGCIVEERPTASNDLNSDLVINKVIRAPEKPFEMDYAQQKNFLNRAKKFHDDLEQSNGASPTYDCENREPAGDESSSFAFLPVLAAQVSPQNPIQTYSSSKCFEEITFEFSKTSETTFDVYVTTAKPKKAVCNDTFLFGNTEIQHFEAFYFRGTHKLSFVMNTPEAQADVNFGGIKAFAFCEGIVGEIESLWSFIKSEVGGLTPHPDWPIIGSHVPPYMEKATLEFLEESMYYVMEERPIKKVEIDPDLIQSGDFLAVMRLEGLGAMIMYGTGSHISHSTMALRFDGELYVVESQGSGFWPNFGIQRTPWDQWIQQAENSDFHVSWLPLSQEYRDKFDEEAANEFFFQTEGLPYGFHNFLYGWIDTANDNWPPLLPKELVPVAFKVFEDLAPQKADVFFTQALNKRLGTQGKTISEIAEIAAAQNMSVEDVMAMVEMDGWEYEGIEPRDGQSYVCSAYVAAMYKAAGLFGDYEVQATEFIPRDIYNLKFFDEAYEFPEACAEADPGMPYCQLLGTYRMTLPGFNTVEPYSHMNEKCSINWPTYDRDEGC